MIKNWLNDDNFYDEKINNKVFLLAKFEKPIKLENKKKIIEKSFQYYIYSYWYFKYRSNQKYTIKIDSNI